jgi:prepilin-type N-terminal cleavage/methylation domain-containing protein
VYQFNTMLKINFRSTRRPGFTLIETLMAFVILAVVLGASLVGSRTLSRQVQVTNAQAQMASLADEAVNALRVIRDQSSIGFESLFQFAIPGSLNKDKGFILGTQSLVATPKDGGPITYSWCSFNVPTCSDTKSLIYPTAKPLPGSEITIGTIQLAPYRIKGELVALRKADYLAGSPENRSELSLMNPLNNNPLATLLSVDTTQGWNYYSREITITKLGTGRYQVDVLVTNFYDKASTVKRSVTLTDFNTAS